MKQKISIILLITLCACSASFELAVHTDRFRPGVYWIEADNWIVLHRKGTQIAVLDPKYTHTDSLQTGTFIFQFHYIAGNWMFVESVFLLIDDDVMEFELIDRPIRQRQAVLSALIGEVLIEEIIRIEVSESLLQRIIESSSVAVSLRSETTKLDVDFPSIAYSKLEKFYEFVVRERAIRGFEIPAVSR